MQRATLFVSRVVLLGLLMSVASVAIAAPIPPTFEQLCNDLGLDASAVADLRAGKNFQRFPREVSDRDIAAGIAFLTKRPPRDVAALFFAFADVTANPNVRASHDISSSADFATLSLGAHGADEAKRYLAAAAGDTLNLSSDEIAAFHALGATASRATVETELRKTLIARWEAYRARGLAGIAPYSRADGALLHGDEEIHNVVQSAPGRVARYTGHMKEVLNAYPKRDPDVKESFRWILYDEDKRPCLTLRHRMMATLDDGNVIFSDRELYVSQGYNIMQGFAGMFAIDGGSLVLFRANTSTGRVEGSAQAMKHSIGRRMMAKQLDVIFERFRDKLDK